MLPFTFPEAFIEAEPEVAVVPVLPLALNELLPEVEPLPEVPLFEELELFPLPEPELLVVPEVLSGVALFLDESKDCDPLVVLSLRLLDEELLLVDPLFEFQEEEPDEPLVAEPEVLGLPEVDAPVLTEPDTPVVAEPEVPVVADPEMPVEPFTPALVPPFIEEEPFTPVPAEPETLPEVDAVPLFQEEPVATVPFIEPDVEAFMPAPEAPLFH